VVVFALIVGLLLLAVAVTMILRAVAVPAARPEVVDQIGSYGFSGTATIPADEEREGRGRLIGGDLASTFGNVAAKWFGQMREEEIRRRLVSAGWYSTSARAFAGYQLMAAIALSFAWVWLAGLAGINKVIYVLGIFLAALFGWYLPSIILERKIKTRFNEIEKALPELIDLLVVTVEAGIGFVGSMRLAAQQLDGPLAQELRLALQEQSMGLSSTEALEGMMRRADTPGVRQFVRAITQGETLGVSIGQILRNLADEMRKRRKAKAEELAQKAPVKMLFPLIFLIFPAMFVVLLLPAVIAISDTLGNQ
jgi:tight adherence protein C